MKVIKKEDLLIIIKALDYKNFDTDDLKRILEKFGDDYFIEGGQWVLSKENDKMKVIREDTKRLRNAVKY